LAGPHPPLVVDVRSAKEHQQKYIEGSLNLPLTHLAERLGELPKNRPLLVHCAGGYRSSVAASILQESGFSQLQELAGGLAAWESAGLALQKSEV
jgi:rhodanese-related sulfurtransferase